MQVKFECPYCNKSKVVDINAALEEKPWCFFCSKEMQLQGAIYNKLNWIVESTAGYCFTYIRGDDFWVDEKNDMEFSKLQDVIEFLMETPGHTIIIRETMTQELS